METDKNVQRDLIISKNKDNETMRQKIYYMVKIGTTYNWGMGGGVVSPQRFLSLLFHEGRR